MTWAEVADAVFRRNEAWLRANPPPGFPQPDPAYDLFHVEAVEAWARRRWGLVTDATSREDAQAILRERLQAQGQARLWAARSRNPRARCHWVAEWGKNGAGALSLTRTRTLPVQESQTCATSRSTSRARRLY